MLGQLERECVEQRLWLQHRHHAHLARGELVLAQPPMQLHRMQQAAKLRIGGRLQ